MRAYFDLIKFSHTIFALPFALLGFTLATLDDGTLSYRKLLLVLLCMVFARSAAMAFNRYLDREIDRRNPRTELREIPSGKVSLRAARGFVILNCLAFLACTALLNRLVFYLAPLALLITLGYSYTKRFTYLCHFVLGLGLALAPVGAYLAVTGSWALLPVLYGAVVILWVSGFDIIYALQDEAFDREERLFSIPVRLGRARALVLGRLVHLACALILIVTVSHQYAHYGEFGGLSLFAGAVFLSLLGYQHTLVAPHDLSRIDLAFFTTNGMASIIFGGLTILDAVV